MINFLYGTKLKTQHSSFRIEKIMEALKKIIVVGAGHMGSAIALGLRRANSESSDIRILNDIQFRFSIIQMPGNPLKKV